MTTPTQGVVERRLARDGALAALAAGALVVAVAWVAVGSGGAVSAAVGAACVLALFVVSALALAWAAPRGRGAVGRALGVGAAVRLIGYIAALAALVSADAVLHEASLAAGIVVTFAVTAAVEVRTLLRSPESTWVDAAPATTGAPPQ